MGVKPVVSLCQRISRLLSAIDAGFPSRMPRKLGAFLRGCARTFLLVALLTGARPSAALPTNLSLSQIQHTAWTAQEGAPADIWALAQSPDGFLMLGTGSGLYRFDGVTFERVIPSNQSELGFRNITALMVLPSGETWIGYYAGGVSELKNGVLTSYGPHEGVPSGWITSFVREIDGTLWVAAREGLGRLTLGDGVFGLELSRARRALGAAGSPRNALGDWRGNGRIPASRCPQVRGHRDSMRLQLDPCPGSGWHCLARRRIGFAQTSDDAPTSPHS
jgi:ligand-binding sensor domain-containing protein